MKFLLLLFLLLPSLIAEDTNKNYSLRFAYGYASKQDLGQIIFGDFSSHSRDLSVYALDAGYILEKNYFNLPLDLYLKGGLSYYNEDEFRDAMEATLYVKLYYNIDFLDNRIRFGFGEGVSYTNKLLETEYFEAIEDGNEPTSKFLNYLDISLDFDLGKLIAYKPLNETYIGYALKHRSGVFGLYNGVHGGSNYNTFYLENNF